MFFGENIDVRPLAHLPPRRRRSSWRMGRPQRSRVQPGHSGGIRYEYQDMTNRNFHRPGRRDSQEWRWGYGATIFDRELMRTPCRPSCTNVDVARDFNVAPEFGSNTSKSTDRRIAREESEAGGGDEADCRAALGEDDCLDLDGILLNPSPASEGFGQLHALPGIAFDTSGSIDDSLRRLSPRPDDRRAAQRRLPRQG